jgi:hypothetical protein
MKILTLLFFLLLLSSCGKKITSRKVAETFLLEPEGSYSATLLPYDSSFTSSFKGLVTVTKMGDSFQVIIKYKNGPKGRHLQGLYAESFCSPLDRLGPMLIAFDGDLSSPEAGSEGFPSGPNFNYEKETSYSLMLANSNLHGKDLNLEGRSIIIYSGDKPAACGVLAKMDFISEDDEPEVEIIPEIHPHQPVTHEPQVISPVTPERRTGGFFGRLWHRMGRWWRRVWGST